MRRKFIVEETGEIRNAQIGEQVLYEGKIYFANWYQPDVQYSILKITEITEEEATPLSDHFDEQNW
jgi:hypothetical protein